MCYHLSVSPHFFFFNHPATTAIYTLSLHDALPIFRTRTQQKPDSTVPPDHVIGTDPAANASVDAGDEITLNVSTGPEDRKSTRLNSSHMSISYAVFCLKKKTNQSDQSKHLDTA